jgi:hypothetical protein
MMFREFILERSEVFEITDAVALILSGRGT